MNIPRFWVRAGHEGFLGWGWSNENQEAARAKGIEVARRVADWVRGGAGRRALRYAYGERPLREEIIREFAGPEGTPRAVMTRNVYGCLVLNAAHVLFVDVDLGEPPERGGVLSSWFGSERRVAGHSAKQQAVLSRAHEWVEKNPGWFWRIYQTRAGIRLAATHRTFDPADPICANVFDWMNADPLYRRLCANQKCFRARLTPKPWRCGHYAPRERWPFLDGARARRFAKWQESYIAAAAGYATCKALPPANGPCAPEIADLISVHDELTRATTCLPLA